MIKTNIAELKKEMTDFEKNQLPFAMSKALNDILPKIKEDINEHIKSNIKTIRSNWLSSPKGILYNRSSKDNLIAEIYSTAEWLKNLNYGENVHGSFAVAQTDKRTNKAFPRVGSRESGKIKNEMRPRNLKNVTYHKNRKAKKQGIKSYKMANADTKGNNIFKMWLKGKEFLVRQKNYKSGKSKLEILYSIVKNKQYKKQLDIEKVIERSLEKYFDNAFNTAFDLAIMTGK